MEQHYRIMGIYQGRTEEIDTAKSEEDALYLAGEYQIAFGRDWSIWAEKMTTNEDDLDDVEALL